MDQKEVETISTELQCLRDELKEGAIAVESRNKFTITTESKFCKECRETITEIRDLVIKSHCNGQGVEGLGIKLVTAVLNDIRAVCRGEFDFEVVTKERALAKEQNLSDEMIKCIEEAYAALEECKELKRHATYDEKKMRKCFEKTKEIALQLYFDVFGVNFFEDDKMNQTLDEKCGENEQLRILYLSEKLNQKCLAELRTVQSILTQTLAECIKQQELETTISLQDVSKEVRKHVMELIRSYTALKDKLSELKMENDLLLNTYEQSKEDLKKTQIKIAVLKTDKEVSSSTSEKKENEYKVKSDFVKGKIEEHDLLKEKQDLLTRYEQKESDYKQLQCDFEKVQKEKQDLCERKRSFDEQLEKHRNDILRLKDVNTNLKSRIDDKDDLLKVKVKEIGELKKENGDYLARLDANEDLLKVKEKEIEKLNGEKEDFLSRLSQYTSAQLTQYNPNIADLSDSYRPTKLAERFSELYDNEWTDAFDVIKRRYCYTEEKAISSLLYILTQAYEFCMNSSKEQDQRLQCILERNYHSSNTTQTDAPETELSCLERNVIHNLKKRAVVSSAKSVEEDFLKQLQKSAWVLSDFEEPHVKAFALSCANICWHMVLHSPPLIIESSYRPEDNFSINKYKYYKSRGTKYKYIVWPVLYLHPEGAVLSKGVAEAE